MKLIFFLIALCLVLLRAYSYFSGHNGHNDNNNGTLTVKIGDYFEQVKWSGKIELTEDERAIAGISPGGYLKFKENDTTLIAESNLQSEIRYRLFDGHQSLPLNDSGKSFITKCLSKMIAWGFYAGGRAERINKKGGYRALIEEVPNLKMENIKGPYLDLLFSNDSLRKEELGVVIRQTGKAVTDADKEIFLRRISLIQLKDSIVSAACLDIISGINSDVQKANLLSRFIQQDSLTTAVFSRIMDISSHFNADMDKQRIYNQVVDRQVIMEEQFVQMIDAAAQQHADIDKSNLLMHIAQKMPLTEKTKAAYLIAAKRINDDAAYGRTVKIIQ